MLQLTVGGGKGHNCHKKPYARARAHTHTHNIIMMIYGNKHVVPKLLC